MLKHGDFTGLAQNYAQYRPAYSESVLTCLLSLQGRSSMDIDFVDVGAGTGIWTRMVARRNCRSVIAIEPNDEMRDYGERGNEDLEIQWYKGTGEDTGLANQCCDVISMASSFHWVDFDKATAEFHRVLRPNGRFIALWNPRYIESSPVFVDIEAKLKELAPHIKRVSSGRADFTETLTERLAQSPYFEDIVYVEGRHTARLTPEQYIGAWRSVNDTQVQAGPEVFEIFMHYVESRIQKLEIIEATYITRAWSARRKA